MASNELLSEIKKAEEDAKKAITEALNNKNNLILEANKKARQIIDDGEIESIKSEQDRLKSAEIELEKKREDIINNGLSLCDSLAVKSKSNISNAVKYLLDEFEKEIRL